MLKRKPSYHKQKVKGKRQRRRPQLTQLVLDSLSLFYTADA